MSYEEIAKDARKKVLELIYKAQSSHIGSNFSCIDIMTVLFEKMDLKKDIFVLSAGWKAASLYYFMWKKGMITEDELNSYCMPGSKWIGLSEPVHPFIKFAGGSMGLGLPAAVGFALSKKLKGEDGTIYCLMSDGEMAIGTTWESALMASHHKLDNLTVIIDYNGFQATGKTNEVLNIEPLAGKWRAFGFWVAEIDGHTYEEIDLASRIVLDKPMVLIAKTTKGKGVSFMENNNYWHYLAPSEEEYNKATEELEKHLPPSLCVPPSLSGGGDGG